MAEEAPYSVVVWDEDEFIRAFLALPDAQQQRLSELMNGHLKADPRRMHPSLLKQLKGAQSHLCQFECGRSQRFIYEIDEGARQVRVVYLGHHSPWEQRGKVGG